MFSKLLTRRETSEAKGNHPECDALLDIINSSLEKDAQLSKQLQSLAQLANSSGFFTSVLFAICDETNYPLHKGSDNIEFPNTLPSIIKPSSPDHPLGWKIPKEHTSWTDNSFYARSVAISEHFTGLIIFSPSTPRYHDSTLNYIGTIERAFKATARAFFQNHETKLARELRKLELLHLNRPGPLEIEGIARGLAEIFHADAATILIEEQKVLYLSATTDHKLSSQPVSYEAGEGITGYVFKTGSAIRLRNAHDREEVQYQSRGIYTRETARYPEEIAQDGRPARFLAVAMRTGRKIHGVVRILRKESGPPFTPLDQQLLQDFSDLLGIAVATSWRIYQASKIIEAQTEAICISRRATDHAGKFFPQIVYANPGARKLFGISDLKGHDGRKLYAEDAYEKIKATLEEAIQRGDEIVGPLQSKVKSHGGDRAVEISYRLVTSPFARPAPEYTIAVIHDLKQHDRLVKLLDKRGLAYFRADADGRTVQSSETECRLTGYSAKELDGIERHLLNVDPKHQKDLYENVRKRDGELYFTIQKLKKKSGEPFFAEGFIHLLRDERGESSGYEGFYEDVTDRLQLQGFLDADIKKVIEEKKLYEMLMENTRQQLLFMTSMRHQLRSPLGALLNQITLLKKGLYDEKNFVSHLKYLQGQIKVCMFLVENFSYMDKILRGETFKLSPVNLTQLAIETAVDFEHLTLDGKLRIAVDKTSLDQYLNVRGHKELLRQVLVNLVDNAIKYSFPGTEIRICGCESSRGRYLQITNQGIPLPLDNPRRIFKRGVRTEEAQQLVPEGTGLGLWLVRKILETHDASIQCTTIRETGEERTAFQIFFPTPSRTHHRGRGKR